MQLPWFSKYATLWHHLLYIRHVCMNCMSNNPCILAFKHWICWWHFRVVNLAFCWGKRLATLDLPVIVKCKQTTPHDLWWPVALGSWCTITKYKLRLIIKVYQSFATKMSTGKTKTELMKGGMQHFNCCLRPTAEQT